MTKALTQQVHEALGAEIQLGDWVIDATVGNGHDTLFLAQAVGDWGRVFGFDIQAAAIKNTQKRLEEANLMDRVELFLIGHEALSETMPLEAKGRIKAVMFNLGYLPGASNKQVITQKETTLQAIEAALPYLSSGGCMSLMLYPGHSGGGEEAFAVKELVKSLPAEDYCFQIEGGLSASAPEWLLLIKR